MKYKIEKNIVPKTRYKGEYPFDDLKIGDSFWVSNKEYKKLSNAANKHKMKDKTFNYKIRREDKDNIIGRRIWRVAVKDNNNSK